MRHLPALLLVVVLSACSLFSGPRYVVFFQERSAQLDRPAKGVIAQVATRANNSPTARIEVIGYTDSAGSPAADVALSQKRAQAVADALIMNGVAPSRLVRKGQGQTGESSGLASRRVEIIVDAS